MRKRIFGIAVVVALILAGITAGASLDTNAQLYDLLETSSIHQRYVRQNPTEAAKVEAYWRSGGAKPVVATAYGRFLVEVNEDRANTPSPPTQPTVILTQQPANPTTSTSATFAWTSTNATSFTCKVDAAAAASCTSPRSYTGLSVAQHTFVVTAIGAGGSAQASNTWTIQNVPPPPAVCGDGLDNDGDTKIDYPADPGCTSLADTDETDSVTPPPPSGSANVWVDTNGGSCARTTLAAYNDATACGSLAAAYSAAVSGDVVGVRDGSYGIQKFAGGYQSTQPSGTKTLTFKGNSTGVPFSDTTTCLGPNFLQIHFGSPNLTFDGINTDANNTKTTGATFENNGDPFTFKNGCIGDVKDEKGTLPTGENHTATNHMIFDNVYFHDVHIVTDGVHNECMWAGVPNYMEVRNSRFFNCATMDIFFTYPDYWNPLPPPYGNVTLENNYFDVPRAQNDSPNGYSLYIAKNGVSLSNQTPMSGWRIRNNFFDPRSYGVNNDQPIGTNNIFCGNTGHVNLPASWKVAC